MVRNKITGPGRNKMIHKLNCATTVQNCTVLYSKARDAFVNFSLQPGFHRDFTEGALRKISYPGFWSSLCSIPTLAIVLDLKFRDPLSISPSGNP